MLRLALEVAAIVVGVHAVEPAPVFAPPLGTPLTLRIERTQTSGDTVYRFSAVRTIVFMKSDAGYRAEMTLVSADSDAVGPGAGFDRAMAALRGVPMRFTLDSDGNVQSLEGLDQHWATLVAAIAGGGKSAPAAVTEQLNGLSSAQRLAMLASALDSIVYADLAGGGVQAEHDIPMRPRPPYGSPAPATARYGVTAANGALVATTTAAFPVQAPAGGAASMTIDETTTVDPATGLLRSSRETRTVELASGTREQVVTNTDLSY